MDDKAKNKYYKLREEEILRDFDSNEKMLTQRLNALYAKNDVIDSQLAGHISKKGEINIGVLERQKTKILNEISETQVALEKLEQERDLFLKNKKEILIRDLVEQIKKLDAYLKFSKQVEQEIEHKKQEIDSFGKHIKSSNVTGKFANIKKSLDEKVYKKSLQKLNSKENEFIKFRNKVKEVLEDPSKIYEGDNRSFLESFYSKYKGNPSNFMNISLDSKRYLLLLGAGAFILFILVLMSVPLLFPATITNVLVAPNGMVTVIGANLGSQPSSTVYRDYPDFSLSDASGVVGAFEAGDAVTPDSVGILVISWKPNKVIFFVQPNSWNLPYLGEHMIIKIRGSNWFYFLWSNISNASQASSLHIPTTIYSTSPLILFNFSENTLNGEFCLIPNTPYVYKKYFLSKGEHVTWVINQSMYLSTEIVLYNQSFNNFISMVENASAAYNRYRNTCTYLNQTSAFCEEYAAQGSYITPYRSLESSIQGLNPIIVALPQDYIIDVNFTAPATGPYFFIILASRLDGITFASSSICYTNSYVYTTS